MKNTLSNVVTLLMFGSTIVTVGVFMIVEKFGAKFETSVCGVMFCNAPFVMTESCVVVPTAR